MRIRMALLVSIAAMTGCPRSNDVDEDLPVTPSAPVATEAARPPSSSAQPTKEGWREHLGKCVIVDGHAVDSHKTGPALVHPLGTIGVSPSGGRWPPELAGRQVQVKGLVGERADLPVFRAKKGEPPMQGIPVPEGEDLEEARKRLVIEEATVNPLRSPEQVEASLAGQLGKVITLSGVLWSLNGHWWFDHDGVDMHVDGLTSVPGWSAEWHGLPVALQGRLDRKRLPRIDQITLKSDRDLAEAYVLSDVSRKPSVGWPLRPCAR